MALELGRFQKYLSSITGDFLLAVQVQEGPWDIRMIPRLHPKSKQDPWSLVIYSQGHKLTPRMSQDQAGVNRNKDRKASGFN